MQGSAGRQSISIATLAALEHRRRTGEGQLIEVAQIEVAACVAAEPVIEYSMNASAQPREGNRCRGHVQGVYPTAVDDAWVALCVRDDADWARMVEAMRRSDLLPTRDSRRRNNGASPTMSSTAVVADWTRTQTPSEIINTLNAQHVPAEQALTPESMYDIP